MASAAVSAALLVLPWCSPAVVPALVIERDLFCTQLTDVFLQKTRYLAFPARFFVNAPFVHRGCCPKANRLTIPPAAVDRRNLLAQYLLHALESRSFPSELEPTRLRPHKIPLVQIPVILYCTLPLK